MGENMETLGSKLKRILKVQQVEVVLRVNNSMPRDKVKHLLTESVGEEKAERILKKLYSDTVA